MIVINDPAVDDWVARQMSDDLEWGPHSSLGLIDEGNIKAGFVYDGYNGASCMMHVAGERFTRQFIWMAFDYPFNQLHVKVIVSPVSAKNEPACRLAERLGGKLLVTVPEGHPEGDLNLYMMRRNECRWIGAQHG